MGIIFFLFVISASPMYGSIQWGSVQTADMNGEEWTFGASAVGPKEKPEIILTTIGYRRILLHNHKIDIGCRAYLRGLLGLSGGDIDIRKLIIEGEKFFPDVAVDVQIGVSPLPLLLVPKYMWGVSGVMSKRFGWFSLLCGIRRWQSLSSVDTSYQGIFGGYRIGGDSFGIVTALEKFSPEIDIKDDVGRSCDDMCIIGYGYIYVRNNF